MKHDCEICRGSGVVRLPIHRKVSAFSATEVMAPSIDPGYRDYPCPECADVVKLDRVAVLDAYTFAPSQINDPAFSDHVRNSAAHRLVDHLLRGGFITFEQGPVDSLQMRYPVVATLGVVSKGQVATLEQRVAKDRDQVARAVAGAAKAQIDNWGSHFGHAEILKRDAKAQVDSALQRVLGEWSRVRAEGR